MLFRSAAEAVAYAKALHALVTWLGICDGNMQEGSFRCDANVSVRPAGSTTLGTRCEIKNLNSFRFMQQAIEYEARRQIELIEDGGKIGYSAWGAFGMLVHDLSDIRNPKLIGQFKPKIEKGSLPFHTIDIVRLNRGFVITVTRATVLVARPALLTATTS